MNLKFLGDALDHWKGSLFQSLGAAQILRDFAVDPMVTDQESWKEVDFDVLARLLRISPAQIIRHQVTLRDRTKFFGEISHEGDLFIDPDTGVKTKGVKRNRNRYVTPAEVGQLLDRSPERLLIIYQHIRGKPVSARVGEVLDTLRDEIGHFGACSYESPTVAMLFLSRARLRTTSVAKHFRTLLGRHAEERIRLL
ncbi:MAG TPA: hypothetical protein VNN18_11770 [Candidatus Xenobia bacterium]|nr:hypothetical protein [Candidatus Xenobia bacterium]